MMLGELVCLWDKKNEKSFCFPDVIDFIEKTMYETTENLTV